MFLALPKLHALILQLISEANDTSITPLGSLMGFTD